MRQNNVESAASLASYKLHKHRRRLPVVRGNMLRKASRILREDGASVLAHRAGRYVRRQLPSRPEVELPVSLDDVLAADYGVAAAMALHHGRPRPRATSGKLTVNWVIAPIAKGAGGHSTLLRFVRSLESQGHTCNLILYDVRSVQSVREANAIVRRHFPAMRATVRGIERLAECDALVATSWQTAYPVFNAQAEATKYYFVQDYEPMFYPAGTLHALAENTYRFGLLGITAGRWLAYKLSRDFGMSCDHFDFGSDAGRYRFENPSPRRKVLFYARPRTPRRGFELGVLALARFALTNPDYEINFVGEPINHRLPFAFVNHGVLRVDELNALYNECAVALVISLTNMSLLPLELLATGCIPVLNDAESNRMVVDNPDIVYADAAPHSLARALQDVISRADLPRDAARAAQAVESVGWGDAEAKVERILTGAWPATGESEAAPGPEVPAAPARC
jgi:glycosyltransferase involved in cell wall biosynthesis